MAAHPTAGGVTPLYRARKPWTEVQVVEKKPRKDDSGTDLVSDRLHKRVHSAPISSLGGTLQSSFDRVEPHDELVKESPSS